MNLHHSVPVEGASGFRTARSSMRTNASFSIKRLLLESEKERIKADRILPQSRFGAEHLECHFKKRRRLGKGEAMAPASGSLY